MVVLLVVKAESTSLLGDVLVFLLVRTLFVVEPRFLLFGPENCKHVRRKGCEWPRLKELVMLPCLDDALVFPALLLVARWLTAPDKNKG